MDWIQARLSCSLEHSWIALREQVNSDFERWKELNPQEKHKRLAYSPDKNCVIVSKLDEWHVGVVAWVRVCKATSSITVKREQNDLGVELNPTLNAKGECRLMRGLEELEFWQASRFILEPVIF